MIIDAHSHILSLADDPAFTLEYGREGSLCIFRSMGRLPSHRPPNDEEWEASGVSRKGWPVTVMASRSSKGDKRRNKAPTPPAAKKFSI